MSDQEDFSGGGAGGGARGARRWVDQDPRAGLVLDLLLATVDQPAPNLAHLLLG